MHDIKDLIDPKTRGHNSVCLHLVIKGDYGKGTNLLGACEPYMDQIVVIHDGNLVGQEGAAFKLFCIKIGAVFMEAPDSGGWPQLHRGLGVALTYTDWLFHVDSDEMPTEELLKGLDKLVANGASRQAPGYLVVLETTEYDGTVLKNLVPRLLRVTPGLCWPNMAHSHPTWTWGRGNSNLLNAPEEMKIYHNHETEDPNKRERRNAHAVEIIMQRWGEYEQARNHARDISINNPSAQEVLECYLQKLEQQ